MKRTRETVLLTGHGSRTKEEDGLEQIAILLHRLMHPGCMKDCVKTAYLQFRKPTIPEGIRRAVESGARRIILHPYMLTAGTHVKKSIPDLLRKAQKRYPDIEFVYTAPLGAHLKLAEVVLERIGDAARTEPSHKARKPEKRGSGVHIIGVGYRPLDRTAKEAILKSEVVLANDRVLDVFRRYDEYDNVKGRIKVVNNIHETRKYISENHKKMIIALLADGDPMFFGIGAMMADDLGRDRIKIYPDLSSVQVAFSRIKESWRDAFLMSLHRGPDPLLRRALEHELDEIPLLLEKHRKIAILTDKENNPAEIAKALVASPLTSNTSLNMYVCERLGYQDERVIEGTPREISGRTFQYPNIAIIIKRMEAV
jgi:precorrin-6y C5,15-methyltransferase (decarboxylating) CbiE subunit